MPSELIKPVFLQHNQFIVTEFKNAADEILRQFTNKYDVSPEDMAYYKGEIVNRINIAMKNGTQASMKNVSNIIREYSVTRGVGEHD